MAVEERGHFGCFAAIKVNTIENTSNVMFHETIHENLVPSFSHGQSVREDVFETANLILRLLSSKDGAVFRRILMIAVCTSC
ncbi:hypothetical protein BHM03_00035798 [Ensete ventricosum]|nr:hypothetical protein BHM03_00035798 [Ensete ventricosum]